MKQLRRTRELTDLTILATDGEIGNVQELYFDDRTWAVRYLVVKAGGWLLSREVLLAPAAVAGAGTTGTPIPMISRSPSSIRPR